MAHLHIHTLPDGVETSIAVIDPDNDQLHWHTIEGERTTTDPFGDGHTHTFEGATTSGPIDRQSNKGQPVNIEHATLSFKMTETKEQTLDGANIGVFSGHLAAFAKDRMDDVFLPGAIALHRTDLSLPCRSRRPDRWQGSLLLASSVLSY